MRRRYVYPLMFGVPALLASLIVTAAVFGAVAGALWLFVYGDDAWPASADVLLVTVVFVVGTSSWGALLYLAYTVGRREEESPALNRRHAGTAAALTVGLAALVILHQWSVGNVGAPSDGVLCSDFCRARGYSGSSIPPRDSGRALCGCLEANGRTAVEAPLHELRSGAR